MRNDSHCKEGKCAATNDPLTGVQIRIGIMGSADGRADTTVLELCRKIGRAVAENGCCLLTGACPGLPHEAVLGAKEKPSKQHRSICKENVEGEMN